MTTNDSPAPPRGVEERATDDAIDRLFQRLPAPLLLADAYGTIESCNLAACELLGYDAGELDGRPLWILCGNGCDPEALRFAADRDEEAQRRVETALRRKDGHELPVEIDLVAFPAGAGHGPRGVVLLRDMSHLRNTEQELERTYQRLAESREATRLRLSRELHDGPVQDLLGVSYRLARVAKALEERDGPLYDHVDDARSDVLDVINDLRGIIQETRPDEVASRGLGPALRDHVEKLERNLADTAPSIDLRLEAADPIPRHVSLCLYRAAQESITNALKHGQAHTVVVHTWDEGERVAMTVEDDGTGFEVPGDLAELVGARHFGLAGLAERVRLMGGGFRLESEPGHGSRISIDVPRERRRRGRRTGAEARANGAARRPGDAPADAGAPAGPGAPATLGDPAESRDTERS